MERKKQPTTGIHALKNKKTVRKTRGVEAQGRDNERMERRENERMERTGRRRRDEEERRRGAEKRRMKRSGVGGEGKDEWMRKSGEKEERRKGEEEREGQG